MGGIDGVGGREGGCMKEGDGGISKREGGERRGKGVRGKEERETESGRIKERRNKCMKS